MDPRIPDHLRDIYQKHWPTIKQNVKRGIKKDVYHYPLFSTENLEILQISKEVLDNYKNKAVKVNVAFGFIVQKVSGELKFFHPSNNTLLFDNPRTLRTVADEEKFQEDIDHEDALQYAIKQRPSTEWNVVRIVCVRFDVFTLSF